MFCDIGPTCYKIALQKEICKRHIKNFFVQESYADTQDTAPLPCIVAQYSSHLIKRGKGTGFAGIENALFYADNTRMLYGDGAEVAAGYTPPSA